ncbi:MAG: fused MFS/spermidine synthase [Solirubrobacterales bacterium]|nr:fused MFS/spermidine synthase [Solirubrobacterales bacterium]
MSHRQKPTRVLAAQGELTAEVDPRRPSGRILRQGGMDASYIDLSDATHLEFDYMRWLRIVLQTARARRILHIGGGACALARALAAQDPGGRQEVAELDPDVLALSRRHLGLRRSPGLRVRQVEGRSHIAAQPGGSWDALVIDAYLGALIPPRLITAEALIDAARVAPLTLVNVVDNRSASTVKATASGLAAGYPRVWALGQRVGNTIVVGCTEASQPDLACVAARAAADPAPARVTPPERLARIAAATPPLRDAQCPEANRAGYPKVNTKA